MGTERTGTSRQGITGLSVQMGNERESSTQKRMGLGKVKCSRDA